MNCDSPNIAAPEIKRARTHLIPRHATFFDRIGFIGAASASSEGYSIIGGVYRGQVHYWLIRSLGCQYMDLSPLPLPRESVNTFFARPFQIWKTGKSRSPVSWHLRAASRSAIDCELCVRARR
jgi:hypothetical protein